MQEFSLAGCDEFPLGCGHLTIRPAAFALARRTARCGVQILQGPATHVPALAVFSAKRAGGGVISGRWWGVARHRFGAGAAEELL